MKTEQNCEPEESNDIPKIAAEFCYEGSAIGIVDSTGHVHPLPAGEITVVYLGKDVEAQAVPEAVQESVQSGN